MYKALALILSMVLAMPARAAGWHYQSEQSEFDRKAKTVLKTVGICSLAGAILLGNHATVLNKKANRIHPYDDAGQIRRPSYDFQQRYKARSYAYGMSAAFLGTMSLAAGLILTASF